MTNPFPPYPYPFGVDDESGPILPPWYTRGWTAQNNAYFPAPPQGDAWLNSFPIDQVFSMLSQYYYDADSNPIGGFLTFWPSDAFTITENSLAWRVPQRLLGTLTFPDTNAGVSPWAFSLEGSGRISIWAGQLVVRLFNTDNPNLVTDSGNPLTYHVTEHFRGGRQFDITVPSSLSTTEFNPLYTQIVAGSIQPFQFDPIDPLGYMGATLDTPPQTGLPVQTQSHLSTDYVTADVSAALPGGVSIDPTDDTIFFAFMQGGASPGDDDWNAGTWANDTAPYLAEILVGPENSGLDLSAGQYQIWFKLVDFPTVIVAEIGILIIT